MPSTRGCLPRTVENTRLDRAAWWSSQVGGDAVDRARQSVCVVTAAFGTAEKCAGTALRALGGGGPWPREGGGTHGGGEGAVAASGGPRPRGESGRWGGAVPVPGEPREGSQAGKQRPGRAGPSRPCWGLQVKWGDTQLEERHAPWKPASRRAGHRPRAPPHPGQGSAAMCLRAPPRDKQLRLAPRWGNVAPNARLGFAVLSLHGAARLPSPLAAFSLSFAPRSEQQRQEVFGGPG